MKSMARYPMLYLLVPLVAGILVCYYTGKPIHLLQDTEANYLDSTRVFVAVVRDYPRECKRTVRCEAEVLAFQNNAGKRNGAAWRPHLHERQGRVYLYMMPDSMDRRRDKEALMGLQIGDTLAVRTCIRRGGKLGDFDYGMYLRQQGIVGTGMVWKGNWRLITSSSEEGTLFTAGETGEVPPIQPRPLPPPRKRGGGVVGACTLFTAGETPASPVLFLQAGTPAHPDIMVRHGDRPSLSSIARRVQRRLYKRYGELGITGAEQATLGALTLGYKEDLDPTLKQAFQRSGAAHILAVSGLHTGIIYAVLLSLLTIGGRCKPLYENKIGRRALSLAVIITMWGYAFLTGLTPSVVRSVVMISTVEAGRMLYRQGNTLNCVLFAAWAILLVRPLDLFSVSFQLSFAAVLAIVLLAPHLSSIGGFPRRWRGALQKAGSYVVGLLVVSLAAQIGTMPLSLYYFGQCSNYFLFTNLLVLPLAGVIVVMGFGSLLLGGIPVAGYWIAQGTKGVVWLLNHAVQWIESLPASFTEKSISLLAVIGLYAGIAAGYVVIQMILNKVKTK